MQTMIATNDGTWFWVRDARSWSSISDGQELYRVGATWCIRGMLDSITNEPARVIDDSVALMWLVSRGHEIPQEMAEFAETRRIP